MRFRSSLLSALAVIALTISGASYAKQAAKEPNLVQVAIELNESGAFAGQFSTLIMLAANDEEVLSVLTSKGQRTVFAPTNAAFAALPAGTVDTLLLPENRDTLTAILTYHVVPGAVTSDQLAGQRLNVATVNGKTVHVDGTDGVTVNDATVTAADILATNGVIHVIDTVILPGM